MRPEFCELVLFFNIPAGRRAVVVGGERKPAESPEVGRSGGDESERNGLETPRITAQRRCYTKQRG